jgi:hypothetical protein
LLALGVFAMMRDPPLPIRNASLQRRYWIKLKNRSHRAFNRVREAHRKRA